MYRDNLATEREGMQIVIEYLRHHKRNPRQTTSKEEQQRGDLAIQSTQGNEAFIEVKVESQFTGNLFVELFSNREYGTTGWLWNCRADWIVFYFLNQDILIGMSFPALKNWLLNQTDRRLDSYKEARAKHSGPNDTYGRLVPIEHLKAAQGLGYWEASPLNELRQHVA